MKRINSFKQFLEIKTLLQTPMHNLRTVGINLTAESSSAGYTLNWQSFDYISKAVYALTFFEELTQKEEVALALAVEQEERNNFLDESDIKMVNDFFGFDLTMDTISKIGGRFI